MRKQNLKKLKKNYAEVEKMAALGQRLEPVLVAVGSIGLLERAYPNSFLDTTEFVNKVEQITKKSHGTFSIDLRISQDSENADRS